jgi:hypothetical protein
MIQDAMKILRCRIPITRILNLESIILIRKLQD